MTSWNPQEFDRPRDAYYADIALRFVRELPVLGINVRFETNSRAVLMVIDDAFGVWSGLAADGSQPSARVRFLVQDTVEQAVGHAPLWYRRPKPDRVLVSAPGSFGVAELDRREAYAYVSTGLVADREHFRYGFVEALTLALLTGANRHPVHAATVTSNGVALMLVGTTGSGKSTVAYAASREGVGVIGEDVAYVQLDPSLAVWAMPGPIRLLPETARAFPEIAEQPPTLLANGKTKVVVHPAKASTLRIATVGVCLLARDRKTAALERVSSDHIVQVLTTDLDDGFDWYASTGRSVVQRLAERGGWCLHLSADPTEAVPHVQRVLSELESELHAAGD